MTGRQHGEIRSDRRAVSETLGYILVFGIMISTITAATVLGFGGLEDRQAVEKVTNVERAFDVLADNFGDVSRYEEPSRATEIRLAGGTVRLADPVTVTVGQWDSGSFVTNETTSVSFRPLIYGTDSGEVIYEAGVVFRGDGTRSIARSPTPFVVDNETAVIPIVATQPGSETIAAGGERTVLIVGERQPNRKPLHNRTVDDEGNELRLRIESPRAKAWERQLRNEQFENVSYHESTDTVEADVAVERSGTVRRPNRVILPVTHIEILLN